MINFISKKNFFFNKDKLLENLIKGNDNKNVIFIKYEGNNESVFLKKEG